MAAKLSFATASVFVVLLALLHFIKPELDPSWRMISEYEIGRLGWVMQVAFVSLAVSCTAILVAVFSQVKTIGGRIGFAFLLLGAAGLVIAAFAVSDPITAPVAEQTEHGKWHAIGGLLGIPSFPIAAVLISYSLGRNEAWIGARPALIWAAHFTWISVVLMMAFIAVLLPQNGGLFGPSVMIGWPNRLVVAAQSAWLMVVAWQAIKLGRNGRFLTAGLKGVGARG